MKELSARAFDLRKNIVEIIASGKNGHIGGDMSVLEILMALYYKRMNISPENTDDPNRDYFILSKGHCVEAYYAVLCDLGFLDFEDVKKRYYQFGSDYLGHPSNHLCGMEMNSGSLGHGLSVGVGIALANRKKNRNNGVYIVMGDGELAEGSVWEGFMAGGMYKLSGLYAIIDRNRLQISGSTEEVMAHEDLHARIASFGWAVETIENGNSIAEILDALSRLDQQNEKPKCLIASTLKGYGAGIMENNASWHHHVPTQEEYAILMEEFQRRKEGCNE